MYLFWKVMNKQSSIRDKVVIGILAAVIVFGLGALLGSKDVVGTEYREPPAVMAQNTNNQNTNSQNTDANAQTNNNQNTNAQSNRPAGRTATGEQVPGGQTSGEQADGSSDQQAEKPTPPPTPYPTPKVLRAYKLGREQDARAGNAAQKNDAATAGLNDIIVLDVENLKGLLEQSRCLKEGGQKDTDCIEQQQRILLHIEGRPLKGLEPESGAPELENGPHGTLRYHLQRPVETDQAGSKDAVADAKENWADLLGLGYQDVIRFSPWSRPVSISVGLANKYPVPTLVDSGTGNGGKFNLVRVRFWRFLFWAALLAGFFYAFLRLAREADIIRDRKPIIWKPRAKRRGPQRKPYSLSRTQIAWWMFFVAFGFIFIWLVTGQHDLSPSVLVLLGISVVTTVGSTVIDRTRTFNAADSGIDDTDVALVELMNNKELLEKELNDIEANIAAGTATQADLNGKLGEYHTLIGEIKKKYPGVLGWENVRFSIDILSDANGVNIHRFQMAMWTVVLGFVFIHEVFTRLSMPEFSGTLLLLMGISNGTYLLGKTTEPQAPPHPPGTTGATDPASPPDESQISSPPGEDDDIASG